MSTTVVSSGAWCLHSWCALVTGAVVFHITATRQVWSWTSVSGMQVRGKFGGGTVFGFSCCSLETKVLRWGHIFLFNGFSLCGSDWIGFRQLCFIPFRNFGWWVWPTSCLNQTILFSIFRHTSENTYFKTMTFHILHLHPPCSYSHLISCFTTSQMR